MAEFTPKKIVLADINNGLEYENGDIVTPSAINAPIEASAYVQKLATNTPDTSYANNVGTPTVLIEEVTQGEPRFSFRNLKGEKGEKGEKGDVGSPGQAKQFTFIVDSDATLEAWATNNSLYDYTSVLIKKGTYSCSTSINLSTTNTKIVEGEAGSLIKISGGTYAIGYDTIPTSNEYYMKGVNVYHNSSSSGRAFYKCLNLFNCCGQAVCYGGAGFDTCKNLISCSGSCSGSVNYCKGFKNCLGVSKCNGNILVEISNASFGTTFETATCSANMKEYNSTYAVDDTANGGFNEID